MLILFPITTSIGQENRKKITVTGLVTDIHKIPIEDAIILVDGEETNTVTNKRGPFKIDVAPETDSISVVALNYPVGKAAVSDRPIVFRLYPLTDSTSLYNQDMIAGGKPVSVVYGQVDETGSVSKVNGQNRKFDSYNSIYDMLRGIPGVQVIQGGGLLPENRVIIRGEASITNATSPLYLVNGMERSEISDILPSMVKDIEILKGPSASIYGTRGAYGVILITLE